MSANVKFLILTVILLGMSAYGFFIGETSPALALLVTAIFAFPVDILRKKNKEDK